MPLAKKTLAIKYVVMERSTTTQLEKTVMTAIQTAMTDVRALARLKQAMNVQMSLTLAITHLHVSRNVETESIAKLTVKTVMTIITMIMMDAAPFAKLKLDIFATTPRPQVLQVQILVINPVEMLSIITKSQMKNVMTEILLMGMDVIQHAKKKRIHIVQNQQVKSLYAKRIADWFLFRHQMNSVMTGTRMMEMDAVQLAQLKTYTNVIMLITKYLFVQWSAGTDNTMKMQLRNAMISIM